MRLLIAQIPAFMLVGRLEDVCCDVVLSTAVPTAVAAEPLLVRWQVPVDVVAWVMAHFGRT